jgi:ribosomal RNA-processing protein 9
MWIAGLTRTDLTYIQAEAEGKIHLFIASNLVAPLTHFISTPSHLPTAIAFTAHSLFVSTKRGSIFRYSLPTLQKIGRPFGQAHLAGPSANADNGHKGEILCLAASEDGKYLVSGGRDKLIGVWDVSTDDAKWLRGMKGHKDAVTVRVSSFKMIR